jgi:hydroxyacylglutathione hydrolase
MRKKRLWIFLAMYLCASGIGGAEKIADSESASHADASAFPQVVKTYEHPGFKITQINLGVLSHYSYIIASDGKALVVDPCRDCAVYLDLAKKEGLEIKGVALTHSHADFVAGHMELAKGAGCPIYENGASGVEYSIEAMKDGSEIAIGGARIRFVETPGHTPDGMCLYVLGTQSKDMPSAVLTGDTLFVGSVGRPDLMGGTVSAAALASMMFDSWTRKLSKLADDVAIFPAHGAGSLCGAHLSDEPSSTVGAQRVSNPYLQQKSRSEFIAAVLDGLPEAPQYFKHNAELNRKGPELVDWSAPAPAELPADASLADPSKGYVVDLRSAPEYAAAHIPGSVNIALRGRLETWVGIMVPWEAKFLLTGEPKELAEACLRLHRVGYRPAGTLSLESWQKAGLPLARNETVRPLDLYAEMQKGTVPVIVDVRLPSEWMGLRIGAVVNLPLNHLDELSAKLDPREPVVAVCNSAYRSSMAVGILERKGFQRASSLAGGSEAWIEAGLPVHGTSATASAAPPGPRRELRIAERISPEDLKRMILDLPGTFELVDIRPPEHFPDYSLPGSRNADLADVLGSPGFLTGAGPLVIVDRDGSLAMMAAGILSQKTTRSIKALHGGLEAYWSATQQGRPAAGRPGAPASQALPPRGPGSTVPGSMAPQSTTPAPGAVPPTSRKKSAGC